jgi:hypothetical protein
MHILKCTVVSVLGVACLGLIWGCWKDKRTSSSHVSSQATPEHVTDVRVTIGIKKAGDQVTFDVPPADLNVPWRQRLQEAVPLKTRASVLGSLRLKFDNGAEEQIVLFTPFGTIARREKLETADLHELQHYLQERCRQIDSWIGAK